MAKYLVPLYASIGRCIEVEADSPTEAAIVVWDSDEWANIGSLCWQCAREVGDLGDWEIDTEGVEEIHG